MPLSDIPLTIIVAATAKNGIGRNGGLPWPMLKKDMAYFARVTKRVPTSQNASHIQSDEIEGAVSQESRRNVVIMGRKTWDSIPPKFRPLKDRTNIVISSQSPSQLGGVPDDVIVASDIASGLRTLQQKVRDSSILPPGRAFVVGGESIYKQALPQTSHVLITRIGKDFECDTFFPDLPSKWLRQTHEDLQDFIGEKIEENPCVQDVDGDQITLDFQLFFKNRQ